MKNRTVKCIGILVLTVVLFLNSSLTCFACDEEQANTYVAKVLFGDNAANYENNKYLEQLESALYICSEQSNKDGQDKLNILKNAKVIGIPALSQINVSNEKLFDCSHNSWEYVSKDTKKVQSERKDVLRQTVVKVFNFGWFNEKFKSGSGQIDSFSALLYYTHILADYLADDPEDTEISVKGIEAPAYSGEAVKVLNGNKPSFTNKQKKQTETYMKFEGKDNLGRIGEAFAVLGTEMLAPAYSRLKIGNIKPSGWNQNKYEGLVTTQPPYVYNRCHLIAHMLLNNDTEDNLITGTRYMNEAMEEKEFEVRDYIKESGNHVLYRATPIYKGNNLVANGVQLEAYSVEDKGKGIQFNVYCYNVQPGVNISYENGANELADKTLNNNDILPFAIMGANDKNPDLIYEIEKQLKILFDGQKETANYKDMMRELQYVTDEARKMDSGSSAKEYQAMKEVQYKYMEALSTYVPKLLKNEKFFKSAFKK